MDEIEIEVTGLDELDRAMAQFTAEFNREAVADGIEAAAAFLAAKAQENAPELNEEFGSRRPGELRESIGVVMRRFSADHPNLTGAWVGPDYGMTGASDPNQDPAYWGQYVEFGSVHNPTANAFLRRALDGGASEAISIFVETAAAHFPKKE